MTSKGKRLTYLTIALGVLVLLVAGYAAKDKAVEQWYIWKLESEDEQERKLAAEKLGEMGSVRAVPSLMLQIEQLEAKYSTRFGYAVSGWPRNFQQSRAIHERYWKRYTDQEWENNWAGESLAKIGTPAIPAMIASLKPDQQLTAWVTQVFLRMRPEALPILLEVMESSEGHVRSQIALVLGSFRPLSENIVQALRTGLHDHNENVRLSAMFSLGAVGPEAKGSVPELVEIVLMSNGLVQQVGIQTLGMIGPDAEAALTNLLQDRDEQVRLAAAEALKRIQDGSARMGK